MKRGITTAVIIGTVAVLVSMNYILENSKIKTVKLQTASEYVASHGIMHNAVRVYDKNEKVRTFKNGIVENEKVALGIAGKIFDSLAEADNTERYIPYNIYLSGDSMWIVQGQIKDALHGGDVYIEIRKKDGCILRVIGAK